MCGFGLEFDSKLSTQVIARDCYGPGDDEEFDCGFGFHIGKPHLKPDFGNQSRGFDLIATFEIFRLFALFEIIALGAHKLHTKKPPANWPKALEISIRGLRSHFINEAFNWTALRFCKNALPLFCCGRTRLSKVRAAFVPLEFPKIHFSF